MESAIFSTLPSEIQAQINLLVTEEAQSSTETSNSDLRREAFAGAWKKKYDLFVSQIGMVGMEMAGLVETSDERGMILLTFSGSLVSLGPANGGKRTIEYASIKFRNDVPDFIKGEGISVNGAVEQNKTAQFEGSPLKQSSAIYRIAVCPLGMAEREQEQRIREATVYLTNGFIKINRTMTGLTGVELDQFTQKGIAAYIAKKHGLTKGEAKSIIDDYLSTIEAGVLLGERVMLGKLGSMRLKKQDAKKARVMKNIATGAEILVPAKPACYVPKFTVSKQCKEKAVVAGDSLGEIL